MHIDDLVFNNFEIKRQMESVEREIFGQVQRIPAQLRSEPNLMQVVD